MLPIRAPFILAIAVSLEPIVALAQSSGGRPILELAPAAPSPAVGGAGNWDQAGGNGRGAEPCNGPLTLASLPPTFSPCPRPAPALELPRLESRHAADGERHGPGLDLLPASVKLDARPGGDADARELGVASVDGIRLDAGAAKLVRQTAYLATIGVVVIGGLILAPESVSKWDTSNPVKFIGSMPANWSEHVSKGPVVDGDKWAINYIGHPISGSFYYQVARHDGFGVIGSTIYSAAMSGLFWEFGIEAMAEIPSTQDLIVTPLGGAVLGEAFYQVEQVIDAGGGTVLGSRVLGGISKFLLNPAGTIVDGIDATVVGASDRPTSGSGLNARSMLVAYPMSYPGHPELRGNYVGLQMVFTMP